MKEYIITENQLRQLTDIIADARINGEPKGTCLPYAFDGKGFCKKNIDCNICKERWILKYKDRLFKSATKELKKYKNEKEHI